MGQTSNGWTLIVRHAILDVQVHQLVCAGLLVTRLRIAPKQEITPQVLKLNGHIGNARIDCEKYTAQ